MSSGQTNFPPPAYPVKGEFIFQNKQVQTAANAVYEYKAAYDAANAAKGKKYQFKTDRERMQYLIGQQNRVAHSMVVPTPPLMVGGTVGDGSIVLNWQPPLKSKAPVLYYKIETSPLTTTVLSVTAPVTFDGLTNGTPYTFSVYAKNVAGFSLAGVSAPLTPATVPSPPRNVVATPGDGNVILSWDAPLTNGGSTILNYTISGNPGGGVTSYSSPSYVNGLTNGTAYTFTIVANNAIGSSDPSAASSPVTPSAAGAQTVNANLTGIVFDGSSTYYQNTFTFPLTNTLTINLTNVGASISVATHIDFQNSSDPLLLNSADTFVLTNPSYTPSVQYVTYGGGAYSQIYANETAGFIQSTSKVVVTFTDARTSVAFKIS